MSNEAVWALNHFPEGYAGYAVELGALDGVYLSNTRILEEKGWNVLCIEPNPTHHQALSRNRKNVFRCACDRVPKVRAPLYQMGTGPQATYTSVRPQDGSPAVVETAVLTLDQCLMVAGFPRLDVLSLDVDGIERDVLAGFDLARWRPRLIIIEEHTDGEMADVLHGYRIETRSGENGCYVRAQ